MSQLSFASLDYAAKKKRTKRERFLAEMDAVVDLSRFSSGSGTRLSCFSFKCDWAFPSQC